MMLLHFFAILAFLEVAGWYCNWFYGDLYPPK